MIRSAAAAAAFALTVAFGTGASAQAELPQGVFYTEQLATQYLARDLVLGAKVHGPNDKIVGDIEDLVMNDDTQIVGVIMGVGGFLGVGE